jgi:hypothetical protein
MKNELFFYCIIVVYRFGVGGTLSCIKKKDVIKCIYIWVDVVFIVHSIVQPKMTLVIVSA